MNLDGSSLTELHATPSMTAVGPAGHRSALTGLLVFACWMVVPSIAHAEPSAEDSALATLLFKEGRALIATGQIPQACQKFAESQRLDPSGGTLLNLARCHEQEGRLASAWSEFKAAQIVARDGGRPDREAEAAHHVSALEPRLSRLSVVVPAAADVAGLMVERDGRQLGRGAWSTAIPTDGGEHVVRAAAPGREPFTATVVLGRELDWKTIEVPILAMPPASPEPVRLAGRDAPRPVPNGNLDPGGTTFTPARLRWLGIGSAAAGVMAWAAGGYFLATALDAKDAAAAHCWVDGCDGIGLRRHGEAVSRGNAATAFAIGGVLLVGTGVISFYVGERSRRSQGEARIPTRWAVSAAPGAVMTTLAGGL